MSGSRAGASSTAEHLKVVSAKFGTCLHPSRNSNVKLGVAETLNSLLSKYNEEFDGVVLAYLHPKLVGCTGKILDGLYPYFHVEIAAKLLLFCPKSGMKLDGKVNKLGKDHLGVLVLNIFNASIAVADIRDDLQYQGPEDSVPHSQRAWCNRTDRRHVIRLGSIITFTVKSVQEAEQFIDITVLCSPKIQDVRCGWPAGPSLKNGFLILQHPAGLHRMVSQHTNHISQLQALMSTRDQGREKSMKILFKRITNSREKDIERLRS